MNTKSIFASKTIWGIIISALPTILGLFGLHVADTGAFTDDVGKNIEEITTLAGAALAAYGRVKATSALVVKAPKE